MISSGPLQPMDGEALSVASSGQGSGSLQTSIVMLNRNSMEEDGQDMDETVEDVWRGSRGSTTPETARRP